MSWIWAALMPHPPVIVPEVGRGDESGAEATVKGCEALAGMLRMPDVLLVLSPHQPYAAGALRVNSSEEMRGSFAHFGAPDVSFTLHSDTEELPALTSFLASRGIVSRTGASPDITSDQGTTVPLYFLRKAWGGLPKVIVASPIGLSPREAFEAGRALAGFDDGGKSRALLASGDLSHRLFPGAPAGFAPEGAVFDSAVEEALRTCSPDPLLSLSDETAEAAGECGFRSVMFMLGLAGALGADIEVLSHEGPFGVGYCSAVSVFAREDDMPPPVALARETIRRLLNGEPLPNRGADAADSPMWGERKACFVSIKKRSGALRGCIGTLAPSYGSLDAEIIANAVSAATRDPRFPPMTADELDDAVISVDVLSEAEPVSGIEMLDPAVYGVIVSKGWQRGVLLPDLEGVDTAEEQVRIAAMKAGISGLDGISLERFEVVRYRQERK